MSYRSCTILNQEFRNCSWWHSKHKHRGEKGLAHVFLLDLFTSGGRTEKYSKPQGKISKHPIRGTETTYFSSSFLWINNLFQINTKICNLITYFWTNIHVPFSDIFRLWLPIEQGSEIEISNFSIPSFMSCVTPAVVFPCLLLLWSHGVRLSKNVLCTNAQSTCRLSHIEVRIWSSSSANILAISLV
jgi:hypothetical protein